MKRFRFGLREHRAKLWLLVAAVLALLVLNMAAADSHPPEQWQYKAVWFKVTVGDNLNDLQREFTDALNREAADGWEYCGRCGHSGNRDYGIDFVVFRRRIQ